jgi:hypothetical protein
MANFESPYPKLTYRIFVLFELSFCNSYEMRIEFRMYSCHHQSIQCLRTHQSFPSLLVDVRQKMKLDNATTDYRFSYSNGISEFKIIAVRHVDSWQEHIVKQIKVLNHKFEKIFYASMNLDFQVVAERAG